MSVQLPESTSKLSTIDHALLHRIVAVDTEADEQSLVVDADNDTNMLGSAQVASGKYFYFGDKDTNGSWRIGLSGSDLSFELRVAGSWVSKGKTLA